MLLSQVLSLAVVSSVLWDFQKGLSHVTSRVGQAASQYYPGVLTGPSTGDPNIPRPTLRPSKSRIMGKTNQVVECMAYAIRGDRLRIRQQAGLDTPDAIDSKCPLPKLNEEPLIEEVSPGLK